MLEGVVASGYFSNSLWMMPTLARDCYAFAANTVEPHCLRARPIILLEREGDHIMKNNLCLAVTTLALAVLPDTALAARATPAQGLKIKAIDVYPDADKASVTFVGETKYTHGEEECIEPIGFENYSEYSRVGIDLTTEGGRAALSVATFAMVFGRAVYVETNDVCLNGVGLFGWFFGGIR